MARLYQVVNDKDEIVGHKLREDIDWKKDIYRIAAVWLTNPEGQVLIAQRALMKDKDPGMWGPAAAGTLEEGETYDSNIYKEAEEELGLTGITFTKGPLQRFYEPRHAFCQWFTGVCDWPSEKFVLQKEEVEQVSWVSLDELRQDVQTNPDSYTPSMGSIVNLLADSTL